MSYDSTVSGFALPLTAKGGAGPFARDCCAMPLF